MPGTGRGRLVFRVAPSGLILGGEAIDFVDHQLAPKWHRAPDSLRFAVAYVNDLYGEEELKRLQRKAARFVNTGLFVTLAGAIASDGLEGGRVLSGVGGQYNFVAMAHALEELLVSSNHYCDSGLLQHDFRNPNAVGIVSSAPGEVAPVLVIPSKK